MEGYSIQPWLVWALVTALLMLGAWMRMGAYLFYLGIAALLALTEALVGLSSVWQVGSFIVMSVVLFVCYWGLAGKKAHSQQAAEEKGEHPPAKR